MLESFMVQFRGDKRFSSQEMGFSVWYVWFSSHLRTTMSSMQHGCVVLIASEHGDDPDAASHMSTGQKSELTAVVHSLNSYTRYCPWELHQSSRRLNVLLVSRGASTLKRSNTCWHYSMTTELLEIEREQLGGTWTSQAGWTTESLFLISAALLILPAISRSNM